MRQGGMPRGVRIVIWTVAIAAVIVLLFTVVFPRVERILEDPTMGLGPDAGGHQAERSPR